MGALVVAVHGKEMEGLTEEMDRAGLGVVGLDRAAPQGHSGRVVKLSIVAAAVRQEMGQHQGQEEIQQVVQAQMYVPTHILQQRIVVVAVVAVTNRDLDIAGMMEQQVLSACDMPPQSPPL